MIRKPISKRIQREDCGAVCYAFAIVLWGFAHLGCCQETLVSRQPTDNQTSPEAKGAYPDIEIEHKKAVEAACRLVASKMKEMGEISANAHLIRQSPFVPKGVSS